MCKKFISKDKIYFKLQYNGCFFGNWKFFRPYLLIILMSIPFSLLAELSSEIDSISKPINIGSRRELFVDESLIAEHKGIEFKLHQPVARETVMTYDKPWEGSGSDFQVIFRDGDIIRMYYTAAQLTNTAGDKIGGHQAYAAYAESKDGINWVRPDLGLFEFNGSKHNNIVWSMSHFDNFTPFKDPNPNCKPDEKYKAVASGLGGLFAFKSADAIHWSYLSDKPIIVKGKFDTQNNAFWDPIRKKYWCYIRDFHDSTGARITDLVKGIRDIRVASSTDFLNWSDPQLVKFTDSIDVPLYTNQVVPYYRAPHLFVGFPLRYIDRTFSEAAMKALPDPTHRQNRMKFSPRYGTVLTNGLFMTSYDGLLFKRWDEPFIPAGPERSNNWVYGDGLQNLGLIETPAQDPTASPEISVYSIEGHWKDNTTLRRYSIRLDGFVSINASHKGGEFITKNLTFLGKNLSLNFATSVSGSILIELQDMNGKPLPGYAISDCDELFGDTTDRIVTWKNKSDVSDLAGKTIRVRMVLNGADVYSMKFN